MKYLILIFSIIFSSLTPSLGGISYGTTSALSYPTEKNVKKKGKTSKKKFFKKKRKPNKLDSKGKVRWLMVVGIIGAIIALAFVVIGLWFAISVGFLSTWFIFMFSFFGSIAITSFILASIYSKNVGVRGTGRGRNQGKATY